MTSSKVANDTGSKTIGTHIPVMLAEMLATLRPRDGAVYLDGTFGGGGYTRAILERAKCHVWAIDRDETAIARGGVLAAQYPDRLHLLHGRFGDMLTLLTAAGVHALDGIVLDIGVSSFQIDDPARGFSFMADGPLDMRMGRHGTVGGTGSELTAATLVNTLLEHELANILFQLGEERASRRVARAIVVARAEAPIETTGRLAGIIRAVLPPDRSGHHPATRSFQALRLKVNDELGEIERGLAQAALLLNPGGRVVVISFHSLEDRIVKRFMTEVSGRAPAPSRHDPRGLTRDSAGSARFRLLTPKALRPGTAETSANPRARSARLRAIERLEVAA
ncbi:MAG: 16S rRNA (cytosine(1402)-N(4))-methyltransferase RsmH [Acetobacteraceae bacterium]|jgi:16S rRNA (cytosine1402-N4)-methyltransferase